MASVFPGALDVLVNPISTQTLDDPTVYHDLQHANANDAIEAIQTTLGINPQGASVSVDARLDTMDTTIAGKLASSTFHAAFGVATLDGSQKLVENVDAAKINSGTLAVARIPSLDAAIITSGSFATARIPNIDASKTTTGVFAAARIPSLDASIITTGTIALARLPGGLVGINTVVADATARLALTGKIDGMIVMERASGQVFWWDATGAQWVYIGGGFVQPVSFAQGNDELAVTSATFIPGTNVCGGTFVAPASGKVYITIFANCEVNAAPGIVCVGMEVRQGSTLGSGTVVRAAASDESAGGGLTVTRFLTSRELLVTGLTPGSTYNVRTMHLVVGGTNVDIFYRELLVKPVPGV